MHLSLLQAECATQNRKARSAVSPKGWFSHEILFISQMNNLKNESFKFSLDKYTCEYKTLLYITMCRIWTYKIKSDKQNPFNTFILLAQDDVILYIA